MIQTTQAQAIAALDAVAVRLARPEHWTKGASARANGVAVSIYHPNATCWCLDGALCLAVPPSYPAYGVAAYALHQASYRVLGRASYPDGNDRPETTHADIIRTIACASETLVAG